MDKKISKEEALYLVAAQSDMSVKDFVAREVTGFPEFYHVEYYVRRSRDHQKDTSMYIVDRESGAVHLEDGSSSIYAGCARVWGKKQRGGR